MYLKTGVIIWNNNFGVPAFSLFPQRGVPQKMLRGPKSSFLEPKTILKVLKFYYNQEIF